MKQRFTLIVLVALFVVVGSYAQVLKDLKQPLKKELQMQQSIEKQKGFRATMTAHAKKMGKDLIKKQPIALRRAAADIIYEQPEGTKVSYIRSGEAYTNSMFGTYYTNVSDALGSVVFGADGKVYFKDLVSQSNMGT